MFDTNIPAGNDAAGSFGFGSPHPRWRPRLLKCLKCSCRSEKEKASEASEFQSRPGQSHPGGELIFGANFAHGASRPALTVAWFSVGRGPADDEQGRNGEIGD